MLKLCVCNIYFLSDTIKEVEWSKQQHQSELITIVAILNNSWQENMLLETRSGIICDLFQK